ncbi:magnesium-translocating P-type ATPase [Glaciimonas soli]|uniref:Magnesium-transporting ATPase, P-type 1 n=1 Tax=Glaciimonas soli TaxID=2590999 RepID=A0A843YTD4_9BURK|nr:magnesium-translocating P-type ATPase [Glaciimonas soli]MQR00758.1 magnesium-translocating P-type ATPase [Glaciimonas soli]
MNISILQEAFSAFIRTHGLERHFQRLAVFDIGKRSEADNALASTLTKKLISASNTPAEALLYSLGTHADGLTELQVASIREEAGFNEVGQAKILRWWMHLWHCYKNPFSLLLTVLATISYFTDDAKGAIVIGSMVALGTLIRFMQESRSNKAAEKLKAMVSNTATVLRRSVTEDVLGTTREYFSLPEQRHQLHKIEIPINLLVPGDIIALSAGDMIPADVRLLTAKHLFVSQAAMTGESLPVEKFTQQTVEDISNPLDRDNLCFMGTNVISGAATAVIVSTGKNTYFGMLADRVLKTDRSPTAFQRGVNEVSWLLIRFMLVMVPMVLMINGFTKHDWWSASLFALSIAVGLTPEMLLMIVTATLAKGAIYLSRKKVIVKRLDAIQNFGAMNVLCTDKTGTLTQDKIFLERHTDIFGVASDNVLDYAYLNSYHQTGLKNLLDVAVLEHVELQSKLNVASCFRKIDEIPFDFQRRRMSVIVSERDDRHLLICKGAVDEILSVCSNVHMHGTTSALTSELLERIRKVTGALNEEGLRVVAVAARECRPNTESYDVKDEAELTLFGYIAFLDPPKESTAPAIDALQRHGVKVKVLTGDNDKVTAKVCREVGLAFDAILLGAQVEAMSDAELAVAVENYDIFAKLTPLHKERIVRALRQGDHIVGFLGDGINDAPALRAADIGISVDSAVDIAKEAADIILLEKSLLVLEQGVMEGRKTFANMLKYTKMSASSNFGNVFSVLLASVFLPFLPMLPLQLLVQNLLYDFSQVAIPLDNVDPESLAMPQRWNSGEIGRFMLFFGPMSSVFDIATFGLMWYVFRANSPDTQTLFQSGWFVEGLLTQTLIVHMIRTRKIPFVQSRASWPLLATTATIMAVGIFLPMGPFAEYFNLQALPLSYFGWLAAILLGYMLLTQAMKSFYARRYGWDSAPPKRMLRPRKISIGSGEGVISQ